jgi:hypothetical protein
MAFRFKHHEAVIQKNFKQLEMESSLVVFEVRIGREFRVILQHRALAILAFQKAWRGDGQVRPPLWNTRSRNAILPGSLGWVSPRCLRSIWNTRHVDQAWTGGFTSSKAHS